MKVTAVVKKRKYLSDLYIDGELAFTLDSRVLLDEGIKKGVHLDDEELHSLVIKSQQRRAKEKALYLLGFRDHSRKELFDKLRRTEDEQAAEYAVEKMEELHFINDERYTVRLAEQLINVKRLSKRAAAQKLYQKGIDRELIDEVLENIELDPKDNIRELVQKKYMRYLNDEKGRKKTAAALQRMGYSWGDIKSVLSEYTDSDY